MEWKRLERRLSWFGEISNREEKEQVARRVAARLEDGQVVGAGSGSTAFLAILALGERARREGLEVVAIPTSLEASLACAAAGLATTGLAERRPDWGFDGADEVDGDRRLIKGRGGAMLREKLVMAASGETLILVDRSKLVERLGSRFPVPVETRPEAIHLVEERLLGLGATEVVVRAASAKDGPVLTEAGNLILDARFDELAPGFEGTLKQLPGVVDTGLFEGYPVTVVTPDEA